jgi:hypothetical protein
MWTTSFTAGGSTLFSFVETWGTQLTTVAFGCIDDVQMFIAAVEADGLNAGRMRQEGDMNPIQVCFRSQHGVANVDQKVADAVIGRRYGLVE